MTTERDHHGRPIAPAPLTARYYVIHVEGDVDPISHGPFLSEAERDTAAKALRVENRDDGIYWLDVENNVPAIGSYTGGFFEADDAEAPE